MQYKIFTASGLVKTGACEFYGYYVNSHSSGTVKVIDGLTAGSGRVVLDTNTLAATDINKPTTLPAPASCVTGIYLVLGGTASVTVFWN